MTSTILWAVNAIAACFLHTQALIVRTSHDHLQISLDSKAEVYYPGSEAFLNATTRWNAALTPQYDAIIKVATEEDVEKIILFANEHNRPFFAISGGHGTTTHINNVKNGFGILMTGMNNITIVDNGNAAIIQGGVINGDLIPYLWSQGKQTVTTGCDCVGYIAPILGGGHGWLQGRYGLAADQLISARMVLANGTTITVNKENNPDLFWGIRGAGHNFGVVTQVKLKVYNRESSLDQWAASGFVFSHDKLEQVYAIANEWLESSEKPVEMIHYGVFAFNPQVDPVNPLVIMWIYWQGPAIPSKYTAPLHALSPIAVDSSVTDLAGVNTHLQATRDGVSCANGFGRSLIPVSLQKYSLPALRKILNIFIDMPSGLRNSVIMLEGYSIHRVDEISHDSTAYPDRGGQLMISPVLTYPTNASLDAIAWEIGTEMRDTLLEGTDQDLDAYVNYARGDETVEELYGHEPWRLEKLRRLKKEYDPHGRFNFYGPIV